MSAHQPPKSARKIFEWFCGAAKVEDLLGDLDEQFFIHLKTQSRVRATVRYWRNVLSLMFSYAIKKRKRDAQPGYYSTGDFSFDMLRNYIRVAMRNLYKYKYFSILNAFGLAVGMSVSLLLIALFSYIKTYDTFQVNRDRIYTVVSERTEGLQQTSWATAPLLLAEHLKHYQGVQDVVRIKSGFNEEIKTERGTLPLQGYYVEPNFLSVFTYDVTQGNARAALAKPNSVVITESAARRLFNSTEVVGKTLELGQGDLLQIGAVMKDHPINSHLAFEVLVSFATLAPVQTSYTDQWTTYRREYIYVLLSDTGNEEDLQAYLNTVAADTYAQLPVKIMFQTQPLDEITMGPDYRSAIGPKWEGSGMVVFAIIALLILLPACFNYTNISIARALKRAKEIGLRKTMGGVKNQIFFQFITETVVITLISLVGGVLIFFLLRHQFQTMLLTTSWEEIREFSTLDLSLTPGILFLFLLFALVTGIVAGIFPALYFGGLNPIQALKNKAHAGSSGMRVRKFLTVFQFALSFAFILSLVVFSRQYQYTLNFDFGFAKENIVNIPLQNVKPELVKTEFSQLASVKSLALSSEVVGLGYSNTWIKNTDQDSTEVAQLFVDRNYLAMFGLTLLAGKNFPDEPWQRERFIIVNEEFLKAYKIESAADAIGRTYVVDGNELEVLGVVKNFHFASLRDPIRQFFFRMNPEQFAYAHLNVQTTDAVGLATELETHWKNLNSEQKFEAHYFDDELNEAYGMYQVFIRIFGFLGLLAITISLLGMLGMVVYTSETKAKEVSIRKVLGATVYSLTFMLSKDYLKLMLIAIVLAAPTTAYLFSQVLPSIQYYSIHISLWDVLFSTVVLVGFGLATITSQTYRSALTNPAETLKSE